MSPEAELAWRAFTDALTGLANRARFHDRAAHALTRQARQGAGGAGAAVLLLDLDDVKTVDDSLGHPAGDALLCAAADGYSVPRAGATRWPALRATSTPCCWKGRAPTTRRRWSPNA